jgi:hypothetical protein
MSFWSRYIVNIRLTAESWVPSCMLGGSLFTSISNPKAVLSPRKI